MFEEEHRIIVANAGLQQALGVVGRGGIDNFQAGRVEEIHFGIGGVERAAVDAAAGGPRTTMGAGAFQR